MLNWDLHDAISNRSYKPIITGAVFITTHDTFITLITYANLTSVSARQKSVSIVQQTHLLSIAREGFRKEVGHFTSADLNSLEIATAHDQRCIMRCIIIYDNLKLILLYQVNRVQSRRGKERKKKKKR